MKTVALVLALLSGVAAQAQPQAPRNVLASTAPGTIISGRVVSDSTGDPIPNARVALTGAPQAVPVVLTDRDGRFTVTVQTGRYGVSASKTGYARRDATPAVPGQAVEIRLNRGAAISGRVLDELGDPVPGVRVAAQTRGRAASDASDQAIGVTDDRGEYRLASLTAGSFVVGVTIARAVTPQQIGGTFSSSLQRTYYPGASTLAEAQELNLRPGDDRPGIDFTVAAPVNQSRPFQSLLALPGRSTQTAEARPTGVVRGRVVSADGRPMPRVQVSLSTLVRTPLVGATGQLLDAFGSASTTTDAEGRFEMRDVPPGKFEIGASKAGYTQVDTSGRAVAPVGPSGFGPTGSARSFDLAAGEVRDRIDLTLARRGALTGRLSDENGDPIQDASVEALQLRYEAGRRWLTPANASSWVTDDLGRYRIHDLPPGQYIVSAIAGQVLKGEIPDYARTFYPGSSNVAEAQFVSIGLSQEVTGIDFALSRIRTASIAGTALNPAGARATKGILALQPSQRSSAATFVSTSAEISPDGTFEFRNVPPGRYVIQAYAGRPSLNNEGEFGAVPVTVNGTDISGVVLQTSLGSTISGHVRFQAFDVAKTPALPRGNLTVSPVPVDFDLSPQDGLSLAQISFDGSFRLSGLNGPRRLQVSFVPRGWALKEIRVNGTDVTDQPLPFGRPDQSLSGVEVVMTDRVSELSGPVTDDRARPAPGSIVVVFPVDRDRRYPSSRFLGRTVADENGVFAVIALPAGSYYAVAVDRIPLDGQEAWQEPSFLESITGRASALTLGDGEKARVTLGVITP
jgi:protocatechuate 3,4-dioxygenase beta subunit